MARQPSLFDAPLRQRPEESPGGEARSRSPVSPEDEEAMGESLPLFPDSGIDPEVSEASPGAPPVADQELPEASEPATVPARLLAGLADVAIHAGVLALTLWGVHLFGIPLDLDLWPPVVLFLVAFSFLYSVVPLAFWGQTPGMASLGLLTCTAQDEHLTFVQTARRWIAGLLTLALLGLPTLLAFGGRRSPADYLSGSQTIQLPEE